MKKITEIIFSNNFIEYFPGDHSLENFCRETPNVLYALTHPTSVAGPSMIAWSHDMGAVLGISRPQETEEVAFFSGNNLLPSMRPYSARYGGHQFGNWAQQLGDGRAITLGEHRSFEIQLKGAGPTPYSRQGDGRAVLRSSFREFIMSEAMFYLGVPTTRALSLVATGDDVLRDMFYDGNSKFEKGAIVTRVAPSFLRFGNFEILFARGEIENLKKLTEWTISQFYPEIKDQNFETKLFHFFKLVTERSLEMVIEWMRVGFVHGVMNTDNMSVLGLTIDYGPFSMMDRYQEDFTPNTTDLPGRRYCFIRQPSILLWNLQRFATALLPLAENKKIFDVTLEGFEVLFYSKYYQMMGKKLGIENSQGPEFKLLVNDLKDLLGQASFDFTLFFSELPKTFGGFDLETQVKTLQSASYSAFSNDIESKIANFLMRLLKISKLESGDNKKRMSLMNKNNPLFIPRNYLLHECAKELEKNETNLLNRLLLAIKNPYDQELLSRDPDLLKRAPEWAGRTPGSSTLSCSS